jgi:hypothetical protein
MNLIIILRVIYYYFVYFRKYFIVFNTVFTLLMQFISEECRLPPKRRFKPEPHGSTSQKAIFFLDMAVKIIKLTQFCI